MEPPVDDNKLRKRLFAGIEEVVDKKARHWEFEDHKWEIINPAQRMVYVPKESVHVFMNKVEIESTKRINKYRDYAQNLKQQFDDYERQSETYYADMLDKFKKQARDVVQKKQSQLDKLKEVLSGHEAKVERMRERIYSKSFRGLLSDDEEDFKIAQEEEAIFVDLKEYQALKAEWLKHRSVIKDWITQFNQLNGRNPNESDTSEIYTQLKAYNSAEQAYVQYRLKMIKTDKLPLDIDEFSAQDSADMPATGKLLMAQRGQGFQQQVVLEEHAQQLQKEIDELRKIIASQDKTGKIGKFIEQLRQKDVLMFERAQKLEEIARQNGLSLKEKQELEQKLGQAGTDNLIEQAKGGQDFADAPGQKVNQIQAQNLDLIQQIEQLNVLNATMLRQLIVTGGKGLTMAQLKEIELDVADSQNRMLEAFKDQKDTIDRSNQAMLREIQKLESTPAVVDQTTTAAKKSKLQQLQQILEQIQQKVKDKDTKLQELGKDQEKMQADLNEKLAKIQKEFEEIAKESKQDQESMTKTLQEYQEKAASAGTETAAVLINDETHKKELEALKIQFDAQLKDRQAKVDLLEKRLQEINGAGDAKEIQALREQYQEAQRADKQMKLNIEKYAEAAGQTKALKEKASILKQHLKEATAELDIVSTKYKEEQVKRKKLLNELEDIKGKVRVYARIRPFTRNEKTDADKAQPTVTITDETSLEVGTQKNRMKQYNFDAVFGPNSTQDEVFDDTKRLIQSAIDGYNVVIFAYGQTGSGKTFTIQGSPEMPGLTPRSIVEMFQILKTMTNFNIKLKCYMVELYLNALRDLLRPPNQEPRELEIKESASGMVEISGVNEVELTSIAQTEQIFENGLAGRKTRKTLMNDASSRSHLIFSIIVDSTNVNTGVRTIGKLSFVDLAGSEKSSKTGTDVQGQEEANAINLSLSALGNVIAALSDGSKHVPYRNHILTKLMKDSLGGNAKTLMFVNCSPSVYNESETKNSLDYATRVKKIKNQVGKNVESKNSAKYREALNQMDSMLEKLKNVLRSSDKAQEWSKLEIEMNKPINPVENEDNDQ